MVQSKVVRNKVSWEWVAIRLETFDAKMVSKENCAEELKEVVKRYQTCTGGDGCMIRNGWSYSHDGNVKNVLFWGN